MDTNITTLERAFSLAKSGECASIEDIKNRLKAEGYSLLPITGPALLKQLRGLIVKASALKEIS